MKAKDILLIIFGILSAGLLIYFSFIEPVISGISKYGIIGFITKVAGAIALFAIIASITHYNE